MATHTAGPWRVDDDTRDGMEWNRHIYAGTDTRVCFMSNDEGLGHGLANARLIAAAPDLLAAAIAANYSGAKTENGKASISREAFDALADAIWKATAV